MNKIIRPDSWDFDAPVASLVDCHSRGIDSAWLTKRAAADDIIRFSAHKAAPGHSLIHLIAMGDADRYGANRNADIFHKSARQLQLVDPNWDRCYLPRLSEKTGKREYHAKSAKTFGDRTEVGNKETCRTFVTHAKVFKDHKNTDEDPSFGVVKAAAHNDRMGRTELLIEVPHGKDWDDDLQKLASGRDLSFSMSCRIPYDICSSCGHKASKPDEYCEHIVKNAGEILKSGHFIGMVNDHMTFFDISRVHRPADRIAWSLMKVASTGVQLSADLALQHETPSAETLAHSDPRGTHQRAELARKAATIEKTVPALAVSSPLAKGVKAAPAQSTLKKLAAARGEDYSKLPSIYRALADESICLPLQAWAEVTLGTAKAASIQSHLDAAQSLLPGIFRQTAADVSVAADAAYTPAETMPDSHLRKLAAELAPAYGISPQHIRHRAVNAALTGQTVKQAKAPAISTPAAEQLARRYTAYKLAFLQHARSRLSDELFDSVLQTSVLQNALN